MALFSTMTTPGPEEKFRFVKYLWQDEAANQLDGADRLVYRSNKLGEDLTLTNTGGGNTSSKLIETDPLTRAWSPRHTERRFVKVN